MTRDVSPQFWNGRRVLLTGHSGFKGAWTATWLAEIGAHVTGLSLPPETEPSLHQLMGVDPRIDSIYGDIRDADLVARVCRQAQPQIVIHMAAQPLVRRSYREPVETFATNVMGTVNVLQSVRGLPGIEAVLVVTSDKTYENKDHGHRYTEEDALGGSDPYSASKAATEIVTASYERSYFAPLGVPVATARAGNVIGGGDWSQDRLIADIWRAARREEIVELRYPNSTRPWQYVLEPICGYLRYVEALVSDRDRALPRALNFGPVEHDSMSVAEVVDMFCNSGNGRNWRQASGEHPPEKLFLAIDASKSRQTIGWSPRLSMKEAIRWTADWYRAFDDGRDMRAVTLSQIATYRELK